MRSVLHLARARAGLEEVSKLPPVPTERPSVFSPSAPRALSYGDWYEPVEELAAFLRRRGVHRGNRIVLLGETRMEWIQSDLAAMAAGGVVVPIYPTLPAAQIEEILAASGPVAAFVSNPTLLRELRSAPSSAAIRTFILMPDLSASLLDSASAGSDVFPWDEALEEGRSSPQNIRAEVEGMARGLSPEDPATLIFTSGTTGNRRGILLTHGNLLTSAISSARALEVGPNEVYLSFLPLSHVLERVVHLSILWGGGRIHYSEGLDRLEQELRLVRPTLLVGVPRLYEKLLHQAEERARRLGPRALLLFRLAEKAAHHAGRQGPRSHPPGPGGWLWNALLYRKVRRALGGRIRILVSGGAPLGSRENLFFNGIGLALLEGYGLTETSSVIAVNTLEEWRLGSVGKPLAGIRIEVAADGEVLVQGPSVAASALQGSEEAVLRKRRDENGEAWLGTGDLGHMDEDGFLYITGRKKDLIVTAQGKKIAPEAVEDHLRRSSLVQEAVVYGDRRPFLVALIYPDLDCLRARLALKLPQGPDLSKALNAPGVRAVFRAEIDRHSSSLAPHEVVREFHLVADAPSVAEGTLTPTRKLRRKEIERKFAREIEELYDFSYRNRNNRS